MLSYFSGLSFLTDCFLFVFVAAQCLLYMVASTEPPTKKYKKGVAKHG